MIEANEMELAKEKEVKKEADDLGALVEVWKCLEIFKLIVKKMTNFMLRIHCKFEN